MGTELKGTQRITLDNGIKFFTDSVRTFTSENPGVWTDMRPGGEARWYAETGVLVLRPDVSDRFFVFGSENEQLSSYGSPANGLMTTDAGTMEFISFGEEGSGSTSSNVTPDNNSSIFDGPSWSGLFSMDAGTMEFSTPVGDALFRQTRARWNCASAMK